MEDEHVYENKIIKLLNDSHIHGIKEISRVAGGKNNRVYSIELDTNNFIIAKFYFYSELDKRNRFLHEFDFLNFANKKGLNNVPKIIATDSNERLCLLSEIPGKKINSDEIQKDYIEQAANFIITLNSDKSCHSKFQNASDACFSIDDHIALVQNRVNQVKRLLDIDELEPNAYQFIKNDLLANWDYEFQSIKQKILLIKSDPTIIGTHQKILSPSDFGFHNIHIYKTNLFFMDFEYSGIDDCVKLVCDFLLSPEIPVPIEFHPIFIEKVVSGLGLKDSFYDLVNYLSRIHRIKWACILLNDFTVTGNDRRHFSLNDQKTNRLNAQLEKAKHLLNIQI